MFSGGAALEDVASSRARRELTALVQRAPKVAQLRVGDRFDSVPIEQVNTGDVVLVRTGEVVPVDGTVLSAEAVVDTSTLSGEPLPETVASGMSVLSGCANAGSPFELRAGKPAAELLPATMGLAALAWAASGDPVRGLAVVVVATPCPLILAAPIALVSGLSRAARAGVIVKGGGTIEALGEARTVLFDKTGTLTIGTPKVREVLPADGVPPGELLRVAASVDRFSAHVLGQASKRPAQATCGSACRARSMRSPARGSAVSSRGEPWVWEAALSYATWVCPGMRSSPPPCSAVAAPARRRSWSALTGMLAG
jgi:cation transport ATPase